MENRKFIVIQFILVLNIFVNRSTAFAYEAPSRCYNPNGRLGVCVSIYECQWLLNLIKRQQSSAYDFIRKSQCVTNGQGQQEPFVCCTSDTGFKTRNDFSGRIIFPDESNEDDEMRNNKGVTTKEPPHVLESSLFPKPPACGPVLIGNKIYGGEEVEIGDFSWLASLEYKKYNGALVSACAGNIINQRYILTAAHCVKGEIEQKVGKLVSVRVGVHNIAQPVDCNSAGCLDASQRLSVAKAIVHPGYASFDGYNNHNDIALLRTDQNMRYSLTVAPVCLPNVFPQLPKLKNGVQLSVAGWGHTGTTKFSPVRLKVELPYIENEVCVFKVASEQLCAGGEYYKDSCTGDSGGGLVRLVDDAWIIEGLVSYGRGCGLERPGIYTRISSYINWIHANVQP